MLINEISNLITPFKICFVSVAFLLISIPLSGSTSMEYDSNQKYFFNIIKNRRTVRNFREDSIPEEHIMKILDVARFCPTAGNQQPWKFLVVRNREKLEKLKKKALFWYMERYREMEGLKKEKFESIKRAVETAIDGALSAPVYVAVLVDGEAQYPDYILHDGVLAAGYLMIAARALGYGTGFFTSFFPENEMKDFFDIPEKYELICFTPIGIPVDWPDTPPKNDLENFVVFESFK